MNNIVVIPRINIHVHWFPLTSSSVTTNTRLQTAMLKSLVITSTRLQRAVFLASIDRFKRDPVLHLVARSKRDPVLYLFARFKREPVCTRTSLSIHLLFAAYLVFGHHCSALSRQLGPVQYLNTIEFFRIEFYRIYRIYRICRILFLVILKFLENYFW